MRCDETRPICRHCSKGKRQCDFPPLSKSPSPPTAALSTLVIADSRTASPEVLEISRLVQLTSTSLHNGSLRRGGAAESFWSTTLPQLTHTHPTVSASAAALGAAIEMMCDPISSNRSRMLRWYVNALQEIRAALESSATASTELAAACVLLAVAETLAGQELPALSHLQGALGLLVQRQQAKALTLEADEDSPSTTTEDPTFRLEDEVDTAAAIMDISTASYALGLPPRLPRVAARLMSGDRSLEQRALVALHAGFGFAAEYNQWRYVSSHLRPTHMLFNQGRLTEQLFRLNEDLSTATTALTKTELTRTHSLRAQCLACLIYIACLFQPRESSYDRFTSTFASIVECAENFNASRFKIPNSSVNLSLELGVVQPLYFTALKCRDGQVRRRAINLLSQQGREGPFDAKQHAAVACRVMELEERAAQPSSNPPDHIEPHNILDAVRVHGAGVVVTPDAIPGYTTGSFSRCRDIEGMILEETKEGHRDPRWWDIWDEVVHYPSGTRPGPLSVDIEGRMVWHGLGPEG